VNEIGVGDSFSTRFKLHEVTILSIERYSVIEREWDCLERDFEKAFQDKLNKLPASQKNPSPVSDSEKKKESSNISKVES
jgi:mRNA-degrading endonuclease RelE of RelBE toxin-antitoxin system